MLGTLAAAVLAVGVADDSAPSPSTGSAVRVKPQVRRVRPLKRDAVQDDSNSSYAALRLRRILPSRVPGWMERAAWRLRERLSWIRGLKLWCRDSILIGLERARGPGRFKA